MNVTIPNAPRSTSDPVMLNCGSCGGTFPAGYSHSCPPPKTISEDDVRRIVREELARRGSDSRGVA